MPKQPFRPNPGMVQNRNSNRSLHQNFKKSSHDPMTQNQNQMRIPQKNVVKMQSSKGYTPNNNSRFQKPNYGTPYKPNQPIHGKMPPSSNIRYTNNQQN